MQIKKKYAVVVCLGALACLMLIPPSVEAINAPSVTATPKKATIIDTAQIMAQIAALQTQIKSLQELLAQSGGQPAVWCYNFERKLKFGNNGEDIRALQTALSKEGFYESAVNGSFDERTASAVVGFQQKYQEEILSPWGLKYGTGFVGGTTIAKLNKIYGCGVTPIPVPIPTPIPTPTPIPVPISPFPGKIISIDIVTPKQGEIITDTIKIEAVAESQSQMKSMGFAIKQGQTGIHTIFTECADEAEDVPIGEDKPMASYKRTCWYKWNPGSYDGKAIITVDVKDVSGNKDSDFVAVVVSPQQKCISEGKKGNGTNGDVCCSGLKEISDSYGNGITCAIAIDQGAFVCSHCGNDICGLGENACNCPDDCEEEDNLPPVIDGVASPTQLKINQQGAWKVEAHDPENGTLTYSVDWGDEYAHITEQAEPSGAAEKVTQTTSFTHSYNIAGTYTVIFTVTDDHRQTAKTSSTVKVVGEVATCTDSDGGKNYYVKGEARSSDSSIDGRIDCCKAEYSTYMGDSADHVGPGGGPCVSEGTYLYEAICENDIPTSVVYKCPGVCENGVCTEAAEDMLTIKGRLIDQITSKPVANVAIYTDTTSGGRATVPVYTDKNGRFEFQAKKGVVKMFPFWPDCYMQTSLVLQRSYTSAGENWFVNSIIFDSAKKPTTFVGDIADVGDFPLWPAVDIYTYSDIPSQFNIEYKMQSYTWYGGAGNINYRNNHSLANSIPLNYDVRIKFTDAQNKEYYSPFTKFGFDIGCKNATLNFTNGEYTWGVCGNGVCEKEQQTCPDDCVSANVCIDSDGGKDYYVNGNVKSGNTTTYDYCVDTQKLSEAVCAVDGNPAFTTFECPYGCENGVCKKQEKHSIIVTSPSATGKQLELGKSYLVTWEASGVEKVNVELEKWAGADGELYLGGPLTWLLGANVDAIAPGYTNKGEFLIGLSETILPKIQPGSYYKIRIVDAADTSSYSQQVADSSDNYFTIFTATTTGYIGIENQLANIAEAAVQLEVKMKELLGR